MLAVLIILGIMSYLVIGGVNAVKCYAAIPFWPLMMTAMFVQGGAKNIPDYREIERLERENFKEIY